MLTVIEGTAKLSNQLARSTVGRGSQRRVRRWPELRVQQLWYFELAILITFIIMFCSVVNVFC